MGVHYDGDLRRTLVRAAADDIAEHGVDGMSLRSVARRVGVSHAAPAHHFGDRVGLLTAVAVEGFHRFVAHMAGPMTAEADPIGRLLAMSVAYAEFAEHEAGYFDVMFEPNVVRADDADYRAASDASFEALRLAIAACQDAGWRPGHDTDALAVAAWSFAHGVSSLRRQGSLGRIYGDGSLADVVAVAATLVAPPPS
ncbi:MAG: TetR/AcrR family transcriptional regulator [Desertimonas sp.]